MPKSNPLTKLNHLQRYLVEEYVEDYQEGAMTRRQALKYIAAVMGSLAVANTVLAGCAPMPAAAPTAVPQPAAAQPTAAPTMAPPTAAPTMPPPTMAPTMAPPTAAPTMMPPTAAPTIAATPTPAQIAATATQAVLTTTATAPTPTPTAIPVPDGVLVPANDPAIEASTVTFPGDEGLTVIAYQAKPMGNGPFPAIVVAHENRGLTDHILDVTRRLAKAGYVALAVDLLSKQGGTAKVTDPAQIPAALSAATPDELAGHYLAGITYLQGLAFVQKDQLGMTGFCFGGGMTWLTATKSPALKAAVPYYGPNPPLEGVPNINAAVLALYGETDARINAGIPAIEEAMKTNNKVFEKMIYPGAGHAFHNDTGRAYNPAAAVDAWKRTLDWFAKYVKGM
jgi:carboxymethylenebutenolidase